DRLDRVGPGQRVAHVGCGAVVDADRLDSVEPVCDDAGLHVGDAWAGAETQDRQKTRPLEFAMQLELLARGVEQSAEVDIVRLRLEAGAHDRQVVVILHRVDDAAGTSDETNERAVVGDVGLDRGHAGPPTVSASFFAASRSRSATTISFTSRSSAKSRTMDRPMIPAPPSTTIRTPCPPRFVRP